MKKTLAIFIILLVILCFNATIVQAAEEKVIIEPSTNNLKQGETFTVNIHAESTDGINMLTVNYDYDKEKLTLLNYSIPDNYTDWSGENADELVMMITNNEIITAVDCVLTFEVQKNVTDNEQTTIKFQQVGIDTFADSNHRFDFDDTEVTIKIGDMEQQGISSSIVIIAIIILIAIVCIIAVVTRKRMK